MKIALCTHKFIPPLIGGVDIYADRLKRALQRLGNEVVVIAFNPTKPSNIGGINNISIANDSTEIIRIEFSFDSRPKEAYNHAYDPDIGMVAEQVFRSEKPDLIIIMNFYTITLSVVEAAKNIGIPVVHIATDFLPICRRATLIRWDGDPCQVGESIKSCSECFLSHRFTGRLASSILNLLPEETITRLANNRDRYNKLHPYWIFQPYWKQVSIMENRFKILQPLRGSIDVVLAPTKFTQQSFISNGFSSNQVFYLPFGVEPDNALAKLKHNQASHIRFVFIGRLQPYKGAHLLVEAFNKLKNTGGATLKIYGEQDEHEAYFINLKSLMDSNDSIHFAGRIPPSHLARAFMDTDYFVMPSIWHENSPLILLDAIQSQTPVITSNIGGAVDFIQNGENGLIFSMGDKNALQQVLQKVIDQPAMVENLRSISRLPSIDDYIKSMFDLI